MDDPLAHFFHYRLLDGRLLGSEHPAARCTHRVLVPEVVERFGMRAMVTLTPDYIDFACPDLAQHHVPIEGVPTEAQIRRAHGWMQHHLDRGEPVWVHCEHGRDRTGVVLGAYLTRQGYTSAEAVELLFSQFPERCRHPRFREAWTPCAERIREFAGEAAARPPGRSWLRRLWRRG